jgi:hypothetical protein
MAGRHRPDALAAVALIVCEVASKRVHAVIWHDAAWTICARAADMADVCPRWAMARRVLDALTAGWYERDHCEQSRLRACYEAAPREWGR